MKLTGLAVLYAALALNFIHLPHAAADVTHDKGSRMAFEFYAHEHYQFGIDVIQNIGPYGYLQFTQDYSGILPGHKLAFGLLFGLLLAALALSAMRYFTPAPLKYLWAAAFLLAPMARGDDLDPLVYLFILLAAHHLLTRGRYRSHVLLDLAVLVFLALLCLMKSTNWVLIGVLMAIVAVRHLIARRYFVLLRDVGCFAAAVLVFWFLAGQHLSTLPRFVEGAFLFSGGYNEGLALFVANEPTLVALALSVMGLFLVANAARLWQWRRYGFRLSIALLEAAMFFIVWKHAFVRADHAVYFWFYAMAATPLLFLAHETFRSTVPLSSPDAPRPRPVRGWRGSPLLRKALNMRGLLATSAAAALVLCVWGACLDKDFAETGPLMAPRVRIFSTASDLVNWRRRHQALEHDLKDHRATAALPRVRQEVGSATVDQFGFLPGFLLLNDLHYHPRPMPISFAACNALLMRRNADFYRDPSTAPDYLLASLGPVDARFCAQDDSLALLEVFERYRPVLVEHGLLLLKRAATGAFEFKKTPLEERTVAWGEAVPVPFSGSKPIWCSVEIRFSTAGRLESFLYKPPPIFIALDYQGQTLGAQRFVAAIGPAGFLARPLILNNLDLLAAYGIHGNGPPYPTPPIDHFRFVVADKDRGAFENTIRVTWSSLEGGPP